MLYISIIFVLIGVLILIYSLSVESQKKADDGDDKSGSDYGDKSIRENKDMSGSSGSYNMHDLYNLKDENEKIDPVERTEENRGPVHPNSEVRQPVSKEGNTSEEAGSAGAGAILYEDSSDVVNYSTDTGTIDPSLEEYKKIIRIGKGDLLFEKNGISFYTEARLYRFDFHRFEELKTGDNYMALVLRGNNATKLFIFENNNEIISIISESYRSYVES